MAFVGVGPLVTSLKSCAFRGETVGHGVRRQATARWSMASALIVNAPGGGHAAIGFHLAQQLKEKGHEVSIFNAGSEEKAGKKDPFASYSELESQGISISWGDPSDGKVGSNIDSAFGKKFDIIYENCAKSEEEIKPLVEYAKESGVSQFVYVSSCGAYKKSDEMPLVEGDPVSDKSGQIAVEKVLASSGLNYSAFRPIYIVGPKSAKRDYLEFFFHRIVRDRPVPIAGSGDQMTSVTHVGDVASMLASAVGAEGAKNQIFNVVSPRYVTHSGVARLCAKAAGKDVAIKSFDADAFGSELKKFFPFRNQHFFANPGKAMSRLGWRSSHSLEDAIAEAYDEFIAAGRDKEDYDFSTDDKILG